MDIGTGDLTFLTDGSDYICIWSPSGENYKSKNARPLGIIAVVLIEDRTDFLKWQKDMRERWQRACAVILGRKPEDIKIEEINIGGLN